MNPKAVLHQCVLINRKSQHRVQYFNSVINSLPRDLSNIPLCNLCEDNFVAVQSGKIDVEKVVFVEGCGTD